MVGSKPTTAHGSVPEVQNLVTMTIHIVADLPDPRVREAAQQLMSEMARSMQLRVMLLGDRMPQGETRFRLGIGEPIVTPIKPVLDEQG
jgi:hypothetical protein